MTEPVAVCFPPGAGGHFVGSLIKSVLDGKEIIVDSSGHAHHNQLPKLLLGLTKKGTNLTLDSYCYEYFELTESAVHPVAVGHVRNLVRCLDKYSRIVYITFTEQDVPVLRKNYFGKNNIVKIPEIDYNKIKGESWPSYQDYVAGTPVPELAEHSDSPIEAWYWVLPACSDRLHEIAYQKIVGESSRWIEDLFVFLDIDLSNQQYENLVAARNSYLLKQPK
jgi:hypothetical protein